MKRYLVRNLDDIPQFRDSAVTVGSFDGVHIGHRAIIECLHDEARTRNLTSVAITFEPHHRVFFGREPKPFLLTDLDEKLGLLAETSVDTALVLPFGNDLAGLSAQRFLERILLERLGAKLFLVGHDQAIGNDQIRGSERIAREAAGLGLDVETVAPIVIDDTPVSSTRIRTALTEGDTSLALSLLGRPYLLTGRVVHGDERGRELGYPTANITLDEPFKLVPAPGVYIATAQVLDASSSDSSICAMLYVGTRPTFGESQPVIELFLLDWSGDLYDSRLRVFIHKRVRGDRRFTSAKALVDQIRRDEDITRAWFAGHDQRTLSRLTNTK